MSVVPEFVGDGYTFGHRGKTYRLGLVTQQVKGDYEKRLLAKEKDKLREVKEFLTEDEYQQKASALANRYLSGGFALFQTEANNPLASGNADAALVFFALLLGVEEMELISLLSDKEFSEKMMPLLDLVLADSFPGYKEARAKADAGSEPQKKTTP